MDIFKFIIIILILIFIFYFIYSLIFNKNKVIKYSVIKNPIELDNIEEEYNINCSEKINCKYKKQKDLYNKCISCKKKFMCFDENEYRCKFCLFNKSSCNKYGCFNGPPINPKKNNCIKCW